MKSAGLVNRFEFYDSIDSTNAELRRKVLADPKLWPDFSAVAAAEQTAGRGRLDRDWVSETDSSIALSLLLRPERPEVTTWLSLTAGVAVADVVSRLLNGPAVGVKWPNDVLVEGKKISGILAEALAPNLVILGIGLNLRPQKRFPDATSLSEHGQNLGFDDVLEQLLAAFRSRYLLLTLGHQAQIRAELKRRSITIGQRVRAELPDGSELRGLATDIDDDGRLLVQPDDGNGIEIVALSAADVWHLRN
jgi:BirA family transcriptional regulator, biotin operon repressor / biotin---[acetyl-CoA-carboxylase] ligase